MTWTTPRDWADEELVTAALLNTHLRDNMDFLHDEHLPKRAIMWHMTSLVTNGNSLSRTVDTSQLFNHQARQYTPALNDQFTQSIYLQAGTYTFRVLGMTNAVSGKVDWYLDDEATPFETGQDWVSGGTVYNVIQSVADVEIAESGLHVLKGIVSDKNASSTGYGLYLTALWFEPATD